MLDREEYKSLYGTLKKYITILCENSFFYESGDFRSSIADAVKEEISLFLFLAERVGFEDEAASILAKFKEVFLVNDENESPKESFADKKFGELRDDVNYLKVSVRNICEVDLDFYEKKSFQAKEFIPINEPKKQLEMPAHKEKVPDSLAVFRNTFNEGIELDPNIGKELGEFVLRSHAYDRLNKDISEGSIYIYTSKPRVNVIIKYCLLVLSAIGIFLSILVAISSFKDFPSEKLFCCIFSLLGVVYFPWNIYTLNKQLKNDNFKYSFGRKEFVNNSVFLLSFLIFSYPQSAGLSYLENIKGDVTLYYSLVSFLILAVLMEIIHIASYFLFQPKKDTKLIDEVLNRHMSDISKGASL